MCGHCPPYLYLPRVQKPPTPSQARARRSWFATTSPPPPTTKTVAATKTAATMTTTINGPNEEADGCFLPSLSMSSSGGGYNGNGVAPTTTAGLR